MQKLRIVLSCTARKRSSDTDYPRLRAVRKASLARRVREWAELVSSAPRRHGAGDLYAGEYWQCAMQLASRAASERRTSVSVISAGLGLVGLDDRIPTYGATLAARHPDSVLRTANSANPSRMRREWWDALTHARVLGQRSEECLSDLANPGSESEVVVCVGRDYLDAVAPDLMTLVERVGDPKKVMIFASGDALPGLEASWVRVPGSLRLTLGGSLSSTAVRAATAVLADAATSRVGVDTARSVVAELSAASGELPPYERQRQSDESIIGWVAEHLAEVPDATKTTALRHFRDQGNACEQTRFGRLFAEAWEMTT